MTISGSINLSDSTLHLTDSANTGYFLSAAPPETYDQSSIVYDSFLSSTGDQTFLQQQILSTGDLNLVLRDWTYFGGVPYDATTYVDGTWMYRWYDPTYLTYSIWYRDYDTTQYSLVGYRFRDPITQHVGNYYAPMVVPRTPGHYQIRWLYTKDDTAYGKQIVQPFTAVSRGIDSMRDYPYLAGQNYYPFQTDAGNDIGALVQAIPVTQLKNLGDTAIVTLQFNGAVPTPISYLWRMNGNAIYDGDKFSGVTTDTLTIYNMTVNEASMFSCVISNQIYSTSALIVVDPP